MSITEVKTAYNPKVKKEFVEAIENSKSIGGALKKLHCNRKSLMKYFENYNIDIPEDWSSETKLIKAYVKMAIQKSETCDIQDIMKKLGSIMPEKLQYKIKFTQIQSVLNSLLEKFAS